jgi:hypothetical protein
MKLDLCQVAPLSVRLASTALTQKALLFQPIADFLIQ